MIYKVCYCWVTISGLIRETNNLTLIENLQNKISLYGWAMVSVRHSVIRPSTGRNTTCIEVQLLE